MYKLCFIFRSIATLADLNQYYQGMANHEERNEILKKIQEEAPRTPFLTPDQKGHLKTINRKIDCLQSERVNEANGDYLTKILREVRLLLLERKSIDESIQSVLTIHDLDELRSWVISLSSDLAVKHPVAVAVKTAYIAPFLSKRLSATEKEKIVDIPEMKFLYSALHTSPKPITNQTPMVFREIECAVNALRNSTTWQEVCPQAKADFLI